MSIQHMTAVFDLPEPTGSTRWVLLVLAEHANAQTGECWPSESRIATRAGIHTATVRRAIQELERDGFIVVQRMSGRTNRYLLCVEPAATARAVNPAHDAPGKAPAPSAPRPYTQRTMHLHPAHLAPQTTKNQNETEGRSATDEPEPMTANAALTALRAVLGRKEGSA